MMNLDVYHCYAYPKEGGAYKAACFIGSPTVAGVDAQHLADKLILTGLYTKIDVRDALGRLIYSR